MKLIQASVIGLAMAAMAGTTHAAVPAISFDKAFYSKKEGSGSVTVVCDSANGSVFCVGY